MHDCWLHCTWHTNGHWHTNWLPASSSPICNLHQNVQLRVVPLPDRLVARLASNCSSIRPLRPMHLNPKWLRWPNLCFYCLHLIFMRPLLCIILTVTLKCLNSLILDILDWLTIFRTRCDKLPTVVLFILWFDRLNNLARVSFLPFSRLNRLTTLFASTLCKLLGQACLFWESLSEPSTAHSHWQLHKQHSAQCRQTL